MGFSLVLSDQTFEVGPDDRPDDHVAGALQADAKAQEPPWPPRYVLGDVTTEKPSRDVSKPRSGTACRSGNFTKHPHLTP